MNRKRVGGWAAEGVCIRKWHCRWWHTQAKHSIRNQQTSTAQGGPAMATASQPN